MTRKNEHKEKKREEMLLVLIRFFIAVLGSLTDKKVKKRDDIVSYIWYRINSVLIFKMAESQGFEPWVSFHLHSLSKTAP